MVPVVYIIEISHYSSFNTAVGEPIPTLDGGSN